MNAGSLSSVTASLNQHGLTHYPSKTYCSFTGNKVLPLVQSHVD